MTAAAGRQLAARPTYTLPSHVSSQKLTPCTPVGCHLQQSAHSTVATHKQPATTQPYLTGTKPAAICRPLPSAAAPAAAAAAGRPPCCCWPFTAHAGVPAPVLVAVTAGSPAGDLLGCQGAGVLLEL